jgi:biopolymer transport protein ExbD
MTAMRHQQRRRDQRRRARPATLNLVSLMDIFTILVFFLMVNSSDPEVLPQTPGVRLPESSADQRPLEQLVISVSRESIAVAGEPVARIADLSAAPEGIIEPLQSALRTHAAQTAALQEVGATGAAPDGLEVTILGDHELPYWLLKRIMQTCQSAEFPHISLAVNQTEGAEA